MKYVICILLALALAVVLVWNTSGCFRAKAGLSGGVDLGEAEDPKPPTPAKESQVKTHSLLRWLIFIGIGVLGASVALAFFCKTAGIAGAAGALATIFAAIVLNQHLVLISWIGLILGVVVLGLLIWYVYENRKELLARGQALVEVVTFNEEAKPHLDAKAKLALYGDKDSKGLAGKIETTETEKRVSDIRKEITAPSPSG